ncbi:GNAT family N-acetyltransferase [Kineococcus glutinatus]|uniref:Chorismate mutase n=1 Tax=Kineococcus glutinatus TaxID=1070872 RepID=A0ABP9H752_9ACTN
MGDEPEAGDLAGGELARVRAEIDALDGDLVALLARRERLVRRAGRLTAGATAVCDPERAVRVVRRARELAAAAAASREVAERTYRAMVGAFVDLELLASGFATPGPAGTLLSPAGPEDAGELLVLQRAAFAEEARRYGDPGLPAMVEPVAELSAALAAGPALKAVAGGRVVGSVRGRVEAGVLHVGRLVVAPDRRGRGIGGALLSALERAVAGAAARAVLFTGSRSAGNLRLYARHGYAEERREEVGRGVVLVHLGKDLPGPPPGGRPG